MRILLDTSVFLKLASRPESIPSSLREAVSTAETAFLSAASAWEIALKASIKKLNLPVSASEYVRSRTAHLLVEPLPITSSHATAVESLPFHHRDPFDRLLVAQAMIEGLTIVTTDRIFRKYGVHAIVGRVRKGRR